MGTLMEPQSPPPIIWRISQKSLSTIKLSPSLNPFPWTFVKYACGVVESLNLGGIGIYI